MKIEIHDIFEPLIAFVDDKGLFLNIGDDSGDSIYFDIRDVFVNNLTSAAGLVAYGVVLIANKQIEIFTMYPDHRSWAPNNKQYNLLSLEKIISAYPIFSS